MAALIHDVVKRAYLVTNKMRKVTVVLSCENGMFTMGRVDGGRVIELTYTPVGEVGGIQAFFDNWNAQCFDPKNPKAEDKFVTYVRQLVENPRGVPVWMRWNEDGLCISVQASEKTTYVQPVLLPPKEEEAVAAGALLQMQFVTC